MASTDMLKLLEKHPSLTYNEENKKVICRYTKHEMPATLEAVESYVKGKKFKNAAAKQEYDYDQHKPHLVPSTKKKHLHELFCKLTLRHIGKSPKDVERHINGKRYKRALARYEKCQATGEKFVPRVGGRPKKKVSDSNSAASGGGEWIDDEDEASSDAGGPIDDDLSDLYPAADFQKDDEEDSEDFNDSNFSDEENLPTPPNKKAKSKKQKVKQVKEKNVKISATTPQPDEDDSDSDYDMSVMDNGDSNVSQKNIESINADSGSKENVKDIKKKKKRKQKDMVSENGDGSQPVKKKKKKNSLSVK